MLLACGLSTLSTFPAQAGLVQALAAENLREDRHSATGNREGIGRPHKGNVTEGSTMDIIDES